MGPSQVIYALLAMFIVGIMGIAFTRGFISVEQRAFQNETLTQVSGVANEILEEIGSRPFDSKTVGNIPAAASDLTPAKDFGGACDPDTDCIDIDDFDGKTLNRSRDGLEFTITVSVDYVDENDPTVTSGSQTFAKQVTLGITTPNIYKENNPDSLITMHMSRVFTYNRTVG